MRVAGCDRRGRPYSDHVPIPNVLILARGGGHRDDRAGGALRARGSRRRGGGPLVVDGQAAHGALNNSRGNCDIVKALFLRRKLVFVLTISGKPSAFLVANEGWSSFPPA